MTGQRKQAAHYFDVTELCDIDNVAAGTNYYPSEAGGTMEHFKDLAIHFVISGGVTLTVEGTSDDAGTPDFTDITKAAYDAKTNTVGNASYIDTDGVLHFDDLNMAKYRVKMVTSDGTNHCQAHSRRKGI